MPQLDGRKSRCKLVITMMKRSSHIPTFTESATARIASVFPRTLSNLYVLRVWDPESGAELCCCEGHTGPVTCAAVAADGRLASGSFDRTVRLWEVPE